jgi:uncharacterized protein (DUF3084 family)
MFKNIKSLFIVEEDEQGKQKEQPRQKTPTGTPKPEPATTAETGGQGQVTQEFTEILFKAMEQANPPGFDYLEFKQSLQSLKKMAMDDATRYQSAFAMAQTMGATGEQLRQSAQSYLNILKNEEQKFAQAVDNQRSKLIGNRQSEIGQLEQIIQSKSEQIKRLNEEIESHKKQVAQLQQEMSEATVKVETTQRNFIASYNVLAGQIETDVQNMQQYLK